MTLHRIKTIGYAISSFSVFLLAAVSWSKASRSTELMACLIAGAGASILGMGLRWLSYEIEERRKGK